MSQSPSASVLLVTVPDRKTAKALAAAAVGGRLAACAQILPAIESHYRWKGRLEVSREILVVFKTTRSRVPALRSRILELHPYETPQCIAVPVESGNPAYLRWIADSVARPGTTPGTGRKAKAKPHSQANDEA